MYLNARRMYVLSAYKNDYLMAGPIYFLYLGRENGNPLEVAVHIEDEDKDDACQFSQKFVLSGARV